MSISTKTGDNGKTSLWSGQRVMKNSVRVEAYGTIDELNSHLGEARFHSKDKGVKDKILFIQKELFNVAGMLATYDKKYLDPIKDENVEKITNWVHEYEKDVKLDGFVIPGNILSSAKLDVCRTVARRAERRILDLNEVEKVSETLIQYVNRLSDLFFILGRYEELLENKMIMKNDI